MGTLLRVVLLLCVIAGVVVAFPTVRETADASVQPALDLFDKRPTKTVLILGNSRVFYHDMPYMLRKIADSTRSPVRLAVSSRTWGGARFEDLWKDARVQRLLAQHWDQVILQGESGAQTSAAAEASFQAYGEKLISAANATSSPVAIIVNWAYAEAFYTGLPRGTRGQHLAAIESGHRALAARTGAALVETGEVFEEAHAADASLALTHEDGNHPTRAGTYLSALMVYGFLADDRVAKASFVPNEVDDKTAHEIRELVAQHYGFGPG
jgi:hypothetical protein